MARQIFNVLVLFVDNFCELLALNHLLVDIHGDPVAEIGQLRSIVTHDLGDGRSPVDGKWTEIITMRSIIQSHNF